MASSGRVTGTADTLKAIDDLIKRSEYVRVMQMRDAANFVLDEIKKKLRQCKDPEVKTYLDSLVVEEAKPQGDNDRVSVVILRSDPKLVKLKTKEAASTAVFISTTKQSLRDPIVTLLAEHSPWTKDTLPVMPPKTAKVSYAKVSKREIDQIRAGHQKQEVHVRAQLLKAGAKLGKVMKADQVQAFQDVSLTGLRIEFGLGPLPHIPHWTPAIQKLKQQFPDMLLKNRTLMAAMLDPKNVLWKTKPKKLPPLDQATLAKYSAFEQMIRT